MIHETNDLGELKTTVAEQSVMINHNEEIDCNEDVDEDNQANEPSAVSKRQMMTQIGTSKASLSSFDNNESTTQHRYSQSTGFSKHHGVKNSFYSISSSLFFLFLVFYSF